MAPLPSLEWSLPSQSGQYELQIQHQPRSHHRAQYETEGSRGAVKTPKGGHPEVQVLFLVWRLKDVGVCARLCVNARDEREKQTLSLHIFVTDTSETYTGEWEDQKLAISWLTMRLSMNVRTEDKLSSIR